MSEATEQGSGVNSENEIQRRSDVINVSFTVKKKTVGIVGVIVGAVIIGAIAFSALSSSQPSVLASAVENCGLTDSEFVSVDDNGKGIFIDGEGEESLGLAIEDTACLLGQIEVPDSVIDKMSSTTAMMGAQDAEFEGVTASWSYHPDNGLDIAFSTQ